MADERTSRSTPPHDTDGPEVEGHRARGLAKPDTGQEAEVEGHRRLSRATDQHRPGDEDDVEGHSYRRATPETGQPVDEADVEGHSMRGKATPEPDQEPEVEGHLNPVLAQDMASAHQRTLHAQADRDRRARTAVDGTDRDGGMLAKIKKFAGRED